jgi:nucleoid DNA-binding protein
MALDEKTVNHIWKGFGSYVAKQLRNGKGVGIPKFGNFSFTATDVDLAVN